jgi:ribosome maturation factor RimP
MGIHSKLESLLATEITALGFEFVGIARAQEGRTSILRVYIDSPEGITIDHCVTVTRQLNRVLDVEVPIQGQYRLEVSSPGLDRPLFTPAHYHRFIGSVIKLKTHTPIEGQRNFVGTLTDVTDEGIVLTPPPPGTAVAIAFATIDRAHLVPAL